MLSRFDIYMHSLTDTRHICRNTNVGSKYQIMGITQLDPLSGMMLDPKKAKTTPSDLTKGLHTR